MFDPYRKWLGIPPKDHPLNYYRLLSIEPFESDLDVIEGAADKQMAFVRQYQSGEYAADAAKILNELAIARLCLLKPATKTAYDTKLRQQLAPPEPEFPEISAAELEGELIPRKRKKKSSKQVVDQGLMIKGGVAVVVVIVAAILFNGRGKPPIENPANPPGVAETNPTPSTKPTVDPSKTTATVASNVPTNRIGDVTQKLPDRDPGGDVTGKTPPKTTPTPAEVTPAKPSEATPAQPSELTPNQPSNVVPEKTGIVKTSPGVLALDKTGIELELAVAAYEKEKEIFDGSVLDLLENREAAARKAGDKKSIDQTTAEREAFESWNVIPQNTPFVIGKRRADARTVMETAFNAAIKSYTRAKDDNAAAATEKKLGFFRGEDWPHLNLEMMKFKGDVFQVGRSLKVSTKLEFSGPIEIHAIARTEKNNIRLYASRGSSVIFNWEVNPRELRVCRPDGRDQPETGSIAKAAVTPLRPAVWYKLRWRITNEGMMVFVNDQVIFSESKTYDLTGKSKISIAAVDSVIDIRDFHVISLTNP